MCIIILHICVYIHIIHIFMLDDPSFIHFVALKGSPIIPYDPLSSRPCAMAALNSLRRAAGLGAVAGMFKSPGWLLIIMVD